MDEREKILQDMEKEDRLQARLDEVIAYAKELERIIEAASVRPHQRILINGLVGNAKSKYNMYNN